jgi:hypothetical protein
MQPQVMQKNMVEVFVINYVMSFEVLMDVWVFCFHQEGVLITEPPSSRLLLGQGDVGVP